MRLLFCLLLLLIGGCIERQTGTVIGRYSQIETISPPPILVCVDPPIFSYPPKYEATVYYLEIKTPDEHTHVIKCSEVDYNRFHNGDLTNFND